MKKGKDEGIFYKNDQKSTLHCLKEQITKPGICTPPHFHRYNEILYGIDCDINVWIDDALENFNKEYVKTGIFPRERQSFYFFNHSKDFLRSHFYLPPINLFF